jgi:hypothetical protein
MGIAKEIYETDGVSNGVKYVLTINEDNSVKLVCYNGAFKVEEPGVQIVDVGDNGGKRVEYGTSKVKASFPFKRYIDGTLDERWTKIL